MPASSMGSETLQPGQTAAVDGAPLSATHHRAARLTRLKRYQLEALARQAVRVPVPVLLASGVVAVTVSGYSPWTETALWIAGICATLLVRWLYSRKAKRGPHRESSHALRVMTLMSFANGAVTGLAAILFLPDLPPERQAILTMIMVCWSAGAVSANAAYGRAFFAYAIPMLTPLAFSWALTGGFEGAWIALLIILFLVIEAGFVRDNERLFRRSLIIQYRNERLVEKLRKERRAVTHERDRAEEANRAKSRFLYSASHDLRQPLSAILINSNVLSKSTSDEKARQVAVDIRQGARSLSALLNSLLNISKLDAGTIQPEFGKVCLDALLVRLASEFRPLAMAKGLALRVDCPSPTYVHTDGLWLDDIIRNLVDNAIKYTECGGVTITALVRDGKALVRIEDTGLGIPEEEHERIFEELYQVHHDRSLGHGLGLAIVRRRSRELGIDVSLESRAGAGSAFTLMIELAGESSASDPAERDIPPAEEHPLPSGLRVLLVDDDERFLRSMQALLEDWDCEVLPAASFEAAIEGLNGGAVDIIVTDYRLPRDKTGIDLIHAARKVQADVPALLLSGDTAPEPPRQAGELGIAFLTKPATEEEIRRFIAIALSGAAQHSGG